MNIQDKMQEIHHKYGVTEKANYEIQLFVEALLKEQKEQLILSGVSGSLLPDLDYWKQRCELAEKCIEESPCDPDITSDQIKAHNAYDKFISNYGNDR